MIKGIILGTIGLLIDGWLIFTWQPDVWWKEVVVLLIGGLSLFVMFSWIGGKRKWGVIAAGFILGWLLLNRMGAGSWLITVLWAAVWVLISLIN
jgi:hypothetical protein